jgi:adenylosuccinate lyase
MPYKKNPITCEKICSLCRHVINQEQSIVQTYINQWLERSLDDSAIKRIVFPECFLIMEHILNESIKIFSKLFFDLNYIETQVQAHMVNIVSEEIILKGVESGYSRQEIHERLRKLLAVPIITESSNPYDIFTKDPIIMDIVSRFCIGFNPSDYIGRSVEQCNYRYCSPLSSLLGNS